MADVVDLPALVLAGDGDEELALPPRPLNAPMTCMSTIFSGGRDRRSFLGLCTKRLTTLAIEETVVRLNRMLSIICV